MTILDREQVLSAFKNRKSCRHYDAARKISAEDFQFILELGRLPWRNLWRGIRRFKPTTSRFWTIRAPCLTGVAARPISR